MSERVLLSTPDAPWLPPGGRADVVAGAAVPEPVCLVRLLATRDGAVHAVPRGDGSGLDLPTRRVDGSAAEDVLGSLLRETCGDVVPAEVVGFVRNTVAGPDPSYPWPVPHAHFVVWHCELPAGHEPPGVLLGPDQAAAELGGRHWWPLAGAVLG